uniref:Uncharacterized protein n=1 Tax=Echinococcus canadensis TaxID=519352 RepID=A0A915EUY8_9CEST
MTKCVSNWLSALLCLVVVALAVWSPVLPWIVTECVLAVWNAVRLIQATCLRFSTFPSSTHSPLFIIAKQIFDLTDIYPVLFCLCAALCLWIIYKHLGEKNDSLIRDTTRCSHFLTKGTTELYICRNIHVKMDRLLVGFVLMHCLLKWIRGEQLQQQQQHPLSPSRIFRSSEYRILANLPNSTLHTSNSNRYFRHRQVAPQLLPPFPPDGYSFEEGAQ